MDTDVLRYAAFPDGPGGGNPAGVVLDATLLDDQQMLAVAADVGYSETAFVTPAGSDREFSVRYFSPLAEVAFCGHATVATAVALAERSGPGDLLFQTPVGPVPVTVTADGETLRATLTSVEPTTREVADEVVDEVLATLRWERDELDPTLPPAIAYGGNDHLVLAAATRARLADLDYDFAALKALTTRLGLTSVNLAWREDATVFHVRNPFPIGGVVEDPATGAAAAAFAGYLRAVGAVPSGEDVRLTLHQGVDMGRPSLLLVDLVAGDPRVRVSGSAAPIET